MTATAAKKTFDLVFMGTPDFAATILEALIDAGHRILAVYTQPPRPAGRGHRPQPSPVQVLAAQHGLALRSPVSLRTPEAQAAFAELGADAAVVAAYGLILPRPFLCAPRLGCLNVHASLLPRWRGAAPIQRALLAGDTETGITIMQMDEGLDTGPILLQQAMPIAPGATAAGLSAAARGARQPADPQGTRRRRRRHARAPAAAARRRHLCAQNRPRGRQARLAPRRDRSGAPGTGPRPLAGCLFREPRPSRRRRTGAGARRHRFAGSKQGTRRGPCSTTTSRSLAARVRFARCDCSGRAGRRSTPPLFCAAFRSPPGRCCRAPLQADDRI